MKSLMHFILTSLILINPTFSQSGRIETVIVNSEALEGNMLGDSPNRDVSIYLPWEYDSNTNARFPVIYILHGWGPIWGSYSFFLNFGLKEIFDDVFSQGTVQPMIIVVANAKNSYYGSWYTNSIVIGNWEEFFTEELVEYIDSHYRTSPDKLSRGIAGHSMGGYGALKLAMKHADTYSAVYSLSGAMLDFQYEALELELDALIRAANATTFNGLDWLAQTFVAGGAAWSPNINTPPFMCDFPVDSTGVVIDSVWQKWLEHDPLSLISIYRDNLLQLNGIKFDCGTSDVLLQSNKNFDSTLSVENIPRTFLTYPGDHMNKIPERVRYHLLPFFSDILVDVEDHPFNFPNYFNLFQNYPNPFNPSTRITYSIPQFSKVVIKVFDILGNEIETLVNEEKNFGNYEITWYAENLPSGIYFYQLTAGDPSKISGHSFVETKKMVLMK